jgi:hypothetical protein
MALTLAQRAELETIAKLLRQGEKPSVSPVVNRRIVRVLREVLGDLAPGPDTIAFDNSPVRSLIEALLAADTAWACPECPPAAGQDFDLLPEGARYPGIDMGVGLTPWAFTSIEDIVYNRETCISIAMSGGSVWGLKSFSAPNLTVTQDVNSGVMVQGFTQLTTVSFPSLTTFLPPATTGGASPIVGVADNSALTTLELSPDLSFATTAEAGNTITFSFSGNALPVETIDFLIHRALLTVGTPASEVSINLSGGTNAVPSNAGEVAALDVILSASGGALNVNS